MTSPYSDLPNRAFWRSGVAAALPDLPPEIYKPKFEITKKTGIFTAGSCFAQHVGRNLRQHEFNVIDTEAMAYMVPADLANRYGYGLFSARFGNIYNIRQFKQLILETCGEITPAHPVWEKDGRFYDAQRPNVEPTGLPTAEQVTISREFHLTAVSEALKAAELVVFTFGLTETWEDIKTGTVYPTAPGTIAGVFDPDIYRFRNFRHSEVLQDFLETRDLMREINRDVKFLLTVSPVPLTATASGDHVLSASSYSKSVLRAVCGELMADLPDVDYFPSFELVSSHTAADRFFEKNKRQVTSWGVSNVMGVFLAAHGAAMPTPKDGAPAALTEEQHEADVAEAICEEELLEAFQK